MPIVQVQGTVVRKTFGPGTRSEHEAIGLETPDGFFHRLTQKGSNPFDYTPFEPFLGKRVRVQGESWYNQILVQDPKRDIIPLPPLVPPTPKKPPRTPFF